tara:strand:+ start:5363 stop:6085 length:723 start_codon:yes stop_codon:yes gene_type:complete
MLADLKLKTDKPILVAASGIETRIKTDDYFVLATGKSLFALDYADIVLSVDLIRIIHNISNFRRRWGKYLIPHRITNTQFYGRSSGILQRDNGETIYLKSPAHSFMYFDLESYFRFNKPKNKFGGYNIFWDSVSYEEVNESIDFKKFNCAKFIREDVDNLEDFKLDDVLRNRSSSLHLILNLLWVNGIKNITTLGVTENHTNSDFTNKLLDLFEIKHRKLENDINFAQRKCLRAKTRARK